MERKERETTRWTHPFEIQPEHVRRHVLPPPVRQTPLPPRLGDPARHQVLALKLVEIALELHGEISSDNSGSATERARKKEKETDEAHDVVDVLVVDLDGNVVNPGLDAVVPPFGVDGRLEHERVRVEKSLEPGRPGVAVLESATVMMSERVRR